MAPRQCKFHRNANLTSPICLLQYILEQCCSACLQVFSLKEQIAHKVAFMQEQLLLPGRPPLIVIGHSIGSRLSLNALIRSFEC